jgi:hypothetical protein
VNVSDGDVWENVSFSFTTEIFVVNNPPVVSNPSPVDGSIDVSVNNSFLSITIEDPDGDTFNWSIECSNGDSSSGFNEYSGVKKCPLANGLDYDSFYSWYVNVTDNRSENSTSEVFTFSNETKKSPGFIFLIIIIAMSLLLFFKKYNVHTNLFFLIL